MVLYKWFLTMMKTVVESSSSEEGEKKRKKEKWADSIWSNLQHVGKTNQKAIKLFIMCSLEGSCSQVPKWPWDEHLFFYFHCCAQRDLNNPEAEITTAGKRNVELEQVSSECICIFAHYLWITACVAFDCMLGMHLWPLLHRKGSNFWY